MEQKMDELIKSINNLSGFSWSDLINLIALIGSWITIFLLLKEKYEKLLYNGQENAVMKVNKGYNYGIYIRSRYHKPA